MLDRQSLIAVFVFFIAGFAAACGGGASNSASSAASNAAKPPTENANAARTNVEELAVLVKVPYDAEDVVWKQFPASKKVISVLRFSPEDSKKIVDDAAKLGPAQPVTLDAEPWFPDELTAQSDMSGDSTLKGTAYRPDAFYQDPYTTGRLIRIEDGDYFVLELSAK